MLTPPSIQIRNATITDLPAIVDIYNATIESTIITSDIEPVTVESRLKWFEEHSKDHYPLWVGEVAGEVIGWISLSPFYGKPAYRITAEISIYIVPHARGKGIGRTLIDQALAKALQLGFENLVAFVFAQNEPSIKLLHKLGFIQWGNLPKVARFDNGYRDLIILGKCLKPNTAFPKELETKRLRLRMFQSSDLDGLAELYADADVMQYLGTGPKTREETQEALNTMISQWQNHGFGIWAVEDKATGKLIGRCGLSYRDNTTAIHTGYVLAKPYWERGLATEMTYTSLVIGFENLKLDRIEGVARATNAASRKVLEKLGMKPVCDAYYFGHLAIVYEITRQEFAAVAGKISSAS